MRVSVLQSSYIPWKGYFDMIHDSDMFIFYDDVQFTKNDWRNRNKIQSPNGPIWLSVPVGSEIHRKINEVEIVDHKWQEKHWKSIRQNYSRAPFFKKYVDWVDYIYMEKQWTNLSELNQFTMKHIAQEYLGIKTKFGNSDEYILQGEKEERLLDLLKQVNCTTYVCGQASKHYLIESHFRNCGMDIEYQNIAKFPEYKQIYCPFNHTVSILDLLFCIGEESSEYIWGEKTIKHLSIAKRSEWDARHFEVNIALLPYSDTLLDIENGIKETREGGIELLIARCPTDDLSWIHELEKRNFRLMDTLLYGSMNLLNYQLEKSNHLVRIAEGKDRERIKYISEISFSGYLSHHRADSKLNGSRCDDLYVRWAVNSVSNAELADYVIVAEKNDIVVGFSVIKIEKKGKICDIDLIAIDPKFRGIGVYKDMITHLVAWSKNRGCEHLEISTQITNIVSWRAWTKVGGLLDRSYYTFHCWL